VTFLDGSSLIPSCINQPLTAGQATCTVSYGSLGDHSVTAVYHGDANFAGSTSGRGALSVLPIGTIRSTMQWTFLYTPRYTKILQFVVNGAPVGATILLKCQGAGCPFAKRSMIVPRCKATKTHKCSSHKVSTVDLEGRFRRSRLAPGARLNVQLVRAGWIGKYYLFTIRSARKPKVSISCLAPGATRPGVGC
jgi:hypothetical protein